MSASRLVYPRMSAIGGKADISQVNRTAGFGEGANRDAGS
jgi:hypothetical protein